MICLATARERERERFAPLEEATKTTDDDVDKIGGGVVKLGEICEVVRGGSPRPINEYLTDDENGLNWLRIGDIAENSKYITKTKEKIKQEGLYKTRLIKKDNLIISNSMSFGRPYITKIDVCIHDGWVALINFKIDILKEFLYYIIKSDFVQNQFAKQAKGSAVDNLNIDIFKNISIPLPDLSTQQEMVNQIEQEEKIIEENKKLIEIMENKMRKKIDNLLNGL